jgi:hypothetical protein
MRRERPRNRAVAALAIAAALLIPVLGAAQEPGQPMPPGHPPAGQPSGQMPPGHGNAGEAAALGMEPPQDDIQEAPDLAAGTIEVVIRDADDRPVDAAPVGLGVLHNSVATGEQRERLNATTDARGVARFESLKIGASHSYAVSSVRGPSRYEADPFNLPEKGGRRVILHVYDTVTDLEEAQIGIRALAFLSLKEDAIQVENMLEVFNLGDKSWQADVPVRLPPDFRAFNKGEDGGVANVDASPEGYVLRGTFKPGRTPIGFRYQVPLSNDESQTVNLPMPPRVAQARIIAEASKQMELAVEGAQPARRTRNRDGQAVLVAERVARPGERGMPILAVTLRGLPTKGPGRFIAVGLAAGVLLAGALYVGSKRDGKLDDDAREDLVEAREALLREIVSLERAYRKGEVGPKSYQRVRAAMLDALAQLVAQLERAPEPVFAGGPYRASGGGSGASTSAASTEVAPSADVGPRPAKKRKRRTAKSAGGDTTGSDPS